MENVNTTEKEQIWDRRKYIQRENMDRQKIQDKQMIQDKRDTEG